MSSHSPTVNARSRTVVPLRVGFRRRALAISGGLVAVAMLIAGCDGASTSAPSARSVLAAGAPTMSMSLELDHIGSPGDSAAVADVSAAWDAAWNAGDASGIGSLFAEDADFVNGRGQVTTGAVTIRANHAAAFSGVFRGTRSRSLVRRVTFLSGSTAVLDVDNIVTGFTSLPGGAIPTQPGLNLQRHKRVLVKRAGHWRTLQMQLTTVAPGAAPVPAP